MGTAAKERGQPAEGYDIRNGEQCPQPRSVGTPGS